MSRTILYAAAGEDGVDLMKGRWNEPGHDQAYHPAGYHAVLRIGGEWRKASDLASFEAAAEAAFARFEAAAAPAPAP